MQTDVLQKFKDCQELFQLYIHTYVIIIARPCFLMINCFGNNHHTLFFFSPIAIQKFSSTMTVLTFIYCRLLQIYIINFNFKSFNYILVSKLQLQYLMFLRTFHLQTLIYDIPGTHPDSIGRFLYFLLPFITLVIASNFFYKKSVTGQLNSTIYTLIPQDTQRVIYIIVLILLFTIGLFVALGDYWTTQAWVLYAVSNLLISLYLFLYQTGKGYTLVLTAVAGIFLGIVLQWLFIQTAFMQVGFADIFVRNIVGAIQAWAIVFALMTVGQVMVVDMGFHKKCEVFTFYILAVLILGSLVIWNLSRYANLQEQIGFISSSGLLLVLTLMNVQRNSNIDASNILK